jgi:hypothetical protein
MVFRLLYDIMECIRYLVSNDKVMCDEVEGPEYEAAFTPMNWDKYHLMWQLIIRIIKLMNITAELRKSHIL